MDSRSSGRLMNQSNARSDFHWASSIGRRLLALDHSRHRLPRPASISFFGYIHFPIRQVSAKHICIANVQLRVRLRAQDAPSAQTLLAIRQSATQLPPLPLRSTAQFSLSILYRTMSITNSPSILKLDLPRAGLNAIVLFSLAAYTSSSRVRIGRRSAPSSRAWALAPVLLLDVPHDLENDNERKRSREYLIDERKPVSKLPSQRT